MPLLFSVAPLAQHDLCSLTAKTVPERKVIVKETRRYQIFGLLALSSSMISSELWTSEDREATNLIHFHHNAINDDVFGGCKGLAGLCGAVVEDQFDLGDFL